MSDRYLLRLLASFPIACCCFTLALLTGAALALSILLFLPAIFEQSCQQNKQLQIWLQRLSQPQQLELSRRQKLQNYWVHVQQILQDSKRYAAMPVQWIAELAYVDAMNQNPFVWAE
ncbi:MAG TPA: hypothetical protein V6C65_31920 [Allocoleopsis sp.]